MGTFIITRSRNLNLNNKYHVTVSAILLYRAIFFKSKSTKSLRVNRLRRIFPSVLFILWVADHTVVKFVYIIRTLWMTKYLTQKCSAYYSWRIELIKFQDSVLFHVIKMKLTLSESDTCRVAVRMVTYFFFLFFLRFKCFIDGVWDSLWQFTTIIYELICG